MKNIQILILLVTLTFSCGKKVTIKGMVYNAITGEGISNVEISLGRANKGVILTGDGVGGEIIATTTTNQDGYYIFEERIRKNRQYSMAFHADSDKYKLIQSNVFSINQENKTIDFPLAPSGKLAKNIINVSCFDENDIFSIQRKHKELPDYYDNKIVHYEGCFEHFGKFNQVPVGWHIIEGTITKNSTTTFFKDSIYVSVGVEHTWNIEY